MSTPSKTMVPRVTWRSRRIILPIVDLPLPLSPMSETTSPGGTPKLTFRTARSSRPPNAPTRYDLQQVSTSSIRPPPSSTRPRDRRDLDERRLLGALLEGERAPGPEAAARRRLEERGRTAGDAAQPLLRVADADLGQRREEHPRVRVRRCVDDRLRRRLLGELAGVHDEDRVGDLVQDREVVRDHDHALDEAAVAELHEQLGHGPLGRDVERGRHLVGDQQRRVEEGREHHHDALLHPARELDRESLEHVLGQPDELRAAA